MGSVTMRCPSLIPSSLRVLFFGSDTFASLHLAAILASKSVSRVEVVCPPNRVRSRKAAEIHPTKALALQHNLPVHEPDASIGFRMKGWHCPDPSRFDIGVVVSFGYRIPDSILRQFHFGMVNVHPSLLPRWRGASPIQRALLNDDGVTGVTIMDLNASKMDSGDILCQQALKIEENDTFSSLSKRLSCIGSQSLVHTLEAIRTGTCERTSQESSALDCRKVSRSFRAPKLVRQDAFLDWRRMSARETLLRWRALKGFMPLYSFWKGNRVIIHDLDVSATRQFSGIFLRPGHVMFCVKKKLLLIGCADSQVVACSHLQLATRKPIHAFDFANGYHIPRFHNDSHNAGQHHLCFDDTVP